MSTTNRRDGELQRRRVTQADFRIKACIIMLKTIIALGVLAMPTVLSATGGVPGSLSMSKVASRLARLADGSHHCNWLVDHMVRHGRRAV